MYRRPWGVSANDRQAFLYEDRNDKNRMGSCKWLPIDGDVCVCVAHTGDCFHNYIAIRKEQDGLWRKVGEFGAYGFGKELQTLPEREFFLLMAGDAVLLDLDALIVEAKNQG